MTDPDPEWKPGVRLVHPEDGEIEILPGYYTNCSLRSRGPFLRADFLWNWKVLSTGEIKSGRGGTWPEAPTKEALA